jgi:hypothetical protein
VELDTILRFCAHPENFPPSPAQASPVSANAFRNVPEWLADEYPELFRASGLKGRLEVYDALWHLVQIHHVGMAESAWRALRELLAGSSHLAELGP